jgi:hypothetical protein
MPPLTEQQKKRYNTFRAEGMPPEKALTLATKDSTSQFNPAIARGVDGIIFGKNSLSSAVVGGVKEVFTGGKRTVAEDTAQFGSEYAKDKAPLSYGASVGRGLGQIVGGVLETADDLTGEVVSDFAGPIVEDAVNSDVGQYLLNNAREFNESQGGVPGEILDLVSLGGLSQVPKLATARAIRDSAIRTTASIVETGAGATRKAVNLKDYFKKPAVVASPETETIREGFVNLERILSTKLDQTVAISKLDEIKDILRTNDGVFSERALASIDDILLDDLTPDERSNIETFLKQIEDVTKNENGAGIVEGYLNGTLDRVDAAAGGATSIINNLSDEFIDRGIKTFENIREVPNALSNRIRGSVDRRIVRIANSKPDVARQTILDLYKKGVVPGVKKKAKTIASINSIDASIKRAVPELAKKYDVENIQDFALAIAAEKKSIFASIEDGLKAAGNEGKVVDTKVIVDELKKLLESERAEFSTPLRNSIARALNEITEEVDGDKIPKTISPSGAQDLIADLNAQLQAYYRGSSSGTNADVIVDNLVVNNLRQAVDDIVDDLGEGGFKELKSRYTDLKRMEDDVVHRAVYEAQKGGKLADLTDITSAGDIIAGALDPAFLARGVGSYLTKEVIKSLTDKDELVRQMFLYGKTIDGGPRSTPVAPNTPNEKLETTVGPSFGISETVKQQIGDIDLSAEIDYKQPFVLEGTEINFFGNKLPITQFEANILKNSNIKFEAEYSFNNRGNKKTSQPRGAYVFNNRGDKKILITPIKGETMERTLQTFFHEVGHAIDENNAGDALRKNPVVLAALKKNGLALVRERGNRAMAGTIKKYNLDEKQVDQLLRGDSVKLEGGYLPGPKKLAKYFRQFDEITAEAYAMFRLNPERLEELAPDVFKAFSEIIK